MQRSQSNFPSSRTFPFSFASCKPLLSVPWKVDVRQCSHAVGNLIPYWPWEPFPHWPLSSHDLSKVLSCSWLMLPSSIAWPSLQALPSPSSCRKYPLPVFSEPCAGIICSSTSWDLNVFLDFSPPQLTPTQVLWVPPPVYLFIPSTFSQPHSVCRPPPFLSWVTARTSSLVSVTMDCSSHCRWRILLEPRSELITPCFKLSSGYRCAWNETQTLSCELEVRVSLHSPVLSSCISAAPHTSRSSRSEPLWVPCILLPHGTFCPTSKPLLPLAILYVFSA